MADFIRRDEAIRAHCDGCVHDGDCWKFYGIYACKEVQQIMAIPAADVRPVVRGKWTRVDYEPCGHDYICSECGCKSDGPWNFCHDCGADMRGTVQ